MEDDNGDQKNKSAQRSQGKLGMIEEHLDDIVTDVKQNLTSLFSRGEQFNELTEKSENLKTHVSTAIFPQTDNNLICENSHQLCEEEPGRSEFRANQETLF